MRRPVALAILVLLGAAPLAARAGDGGTRTLHVKVTRVAVVGKGGKVDPQALPGGQVAAALCDGLQTRAGVACLTAQDATSLAGLQALQSLTGACNGGACAGSDHALDSVDDLVEARIEVKASGYTLHLEVSHPPMVAPVYRADVHAASVTALLAAARAAGVKAAPHLVAP